MDDLIYRPKHFAASFAWQKAKAACGPQVPDQIASRDVSHVTCARCKRTNRYKKALAIAKSDR